MKYVVLLAVVLLVVWLVRIAQRRDEAQQGRPPRPTASPQVPQDMVECPVCLVHLPRTEALPGPGGQHYCCAEHRARAGG